MLIKAKHFISIFLIFCSIANNITIHIFMENYKKSQDKNGPCDHFQCNGTPIKVFFNLNCLVHFNESAL